jgi:hypothetical protein
MDDAQFAKELNKYVAVRKSDFQGASCAPRKKANVQTSAKPASSAPARSTSVPSSAPALSFWQRLQMYAVAKGLSKADAEKLVQAARDIHKAEAQPAEAKDEKAGS